MDLPFFTIELARDTPPEAPHAVRPSGRAGQSWRVLVLGLVLALTLPGASLGGWVLAGGDLAPLIGPATAALASLPVVGDLVGGPVPTPGSAPVHLASQPTGATVWLDGRERGRTPLDLAVVPGAHTVVLRQTDSLDNVARVDVPPEGRALDVALWRRRPEVQPLRAAYPGARVADATFLDDGRLAVATSLPGAPPGQPLREAWLVDPATGAGHPFETESGLVPRAAVVVVAPNGQRLAYLQQHPSATASVTPPASGSGISAARLDEVWLATTGGTRPLTRVFALPPRSSAAVPAGNPPATSAPVERLVDLVWAPDSQHLVVVTAQDTPSGPPRSRLLLVDTTAAPPSGSATLPPVELVDLPAEVVPRSAMWSPDGRWLAFVAHSRRVADGADLLSLCALDTTARGAVGGIRYLADLARVGDRLAPLPPAPVGWAPDASDPASGIRRVLFSAPGLLPPAPASGPLGFLNASGSSVRRAAGGLFLADLSGSARGLDEGHQLGTATGLLAPTWPTIGPAAGNPLVLARVDHAGKPLALWTIDADGHPQGLGVELPPGVAPDAPVVAARWDLEHGRLLLAAPSGTAPSSGLVTPLDYWLVQLAPPPSTGERGGTS